MAYEKLFEPGRIGTMTIKNASDEIKKVFELTGLISVFDIK